MGHGSPVSFLEGPWQAEWGHPPSWERHPPLDKKSFPGIKRYAPLQRDTAHGSIFYRGPAQYNEGNKTQHEIFYAVSNGRCIPHFAGYSHVTTLNKQRHIGYLHCEGLSRLLALKSSKPMKLPHCRKRQHDHETWLYARSFQWQKLICADVSHLRWCWSVLAIASK